jgi:multiple sugar transport system permease protein
LHTETAIQQRKDISDRLFAILLILPAMIVIVFVIVYPLTNAIYTSFFRYFLTDGLGMNFIGLQNYQRMLSSPEFWKAFLHTIEYVGGTVALEFVIAFALALLVNTRFPLKNLINSLLFVPWIIPWLKTPDLAMPTVIAATTWKMLPFMFVILYAGLQAIPREEIEAAKIDGANSFRRFLHVILPNMREIITLATILEFIWQFQYLTIIWTTTRGGPIDRTTTLPILIYRVSFMGSLNMGYASTVGVFWLIFLLSFSMIYVRFVGRREG